MKGFVLIFSFITCLASKPLTLAVYPIFKEQIALPKYIPSNLDQILQEEESQNLRKNANELLSSPLFTNGFNFNLPLIIGGIKYNLTIDTGSSDFVIKGEMVPGVPQQRYRSQEGYQKKKKYFIGYVSAYLSAYEQELDVQLANENFKAPLLVAYSASGLKKTQGILGLSFPNLAKRRPTFLQTLIKNKIIKQYAFGVNLNILEQGRSFISFGQPDTRFYEGQIIQYPINSEEQILVNFQNVQIGDGQVMDVTQLNTYLDTGASTISFSNQFLQIVKNSFESENNFCTYSDFTSINTFQILVCKVREFYQLPDIKITTQNSVYSITKENYIKQCSQTDQDIQLGNDIYYCETFIKVDTDIQDRLSLGNPFFSRFYAFFDLQRFKVGIAKNKEQLSIENILQKKTKQYNSRKFDILNQQQYQQTEEQNKQELVQTQQVVQTENQEKQNQEQPSQQEESETNNQQANQSQQAEQPQGQSEQSDIQAGDQQDSP